MVRQRIDEALAALGSLAESDRTEGGDLVGRELALTRTKLEEAGLWLGQAEKKWEAAAQRKAEDE